VKAFPKDIEVPELKERHIGVESELGIKDSYYRKLPWGLVTKLNKTGILYHQIGYDGGGREFRTVPISVKSLFNQAIGRKRLESYYTELSLHTEVLTTGGTHVHISILDSDHENLEANAISLATAFYEQFQKVSGRKSGWASQLNIRTLNEAKDFLSAHKSIGIKRVHYCRGSILAPTGHKTLEFRGPKGSNDGKEVLAWVDFVNCVVDVANRESVQGVRFGDLLNGKYISEYVKNLDGWRKLTAKDLNKKLNYAKLA